VQASLQGEITKLTQQQADLVESMTKKQGKQTKQLLAQKDLEIADLTEARNQLSQEKDALQDTLHSMQEKLSQVQERTAEQISSLTS
jgi:predicted  nucleic acid-binding Zn-ribbon protein